MRVGDGVGLTVFGNNIISHATVIFYFFIIRLGILVVVIKNQGDIANIDPTMVGAGGDNYFLAGGDFD